MRSAIPTREKIGDRTKCGQAFRPIAEVSANEQRKLYVSMVNQACVGYRRAELMRARKPRSESRMIEMTVINLLSEAERARRQASVARNETLRRQLLGLAHDYEDMANMVEGLVHLCS